MGVLRLMQEGPDLRRRPDHLDAAAVIEPTTECGGVGGDIAILDAVLEHRRHDGPSVVGLTWRRDRQLIAPAPQHAAGLLELARGERHGAEFLINGVELLFVIALRTRREHVVEITALEVVANEISKGLLASGRLARRDRLVVARNEFWRARLALAGRTTPPSIPIGFDGDVGEALGGPIELLEIEFHFCSRSQRSAAVSVVF